jgi:hypothetical protein
MVQALQDAAGQADTARGKLVAIVEAIVDYFDAEPHLFDLIQGVEALQRRDQDFPWQAARDVGVRLVHEIFQEARSRGEFVVPEPELTALLLFGGIRSVIRFGHRPRPRHLPESIVDFLLNGAAL